jgi:hypothetical protein
MQLSPRWSALATRQKSALSEWLEPDMVPIQFAHVPSRSKPARKRALFLRIAAAMAAIAVVFLVVL